MGKGQGGVRDWVGKGVGWDGWGKVWWGWVGWGKAICGLFYGNDYVLFF